MQSQTTMGGVDMVAHQCLLVRGQTVDDQMYGLLTMTHHSLEQFDKQLATERTLVRLKPKATSRIDRRGCRDRLALTGALHHRRLAAYAPSLAVYRVGPKARLVPEEYLRTLALRLRDNGWKALALPPFDGLRVTLIGALQRLLWREPHFGQQRPNRSDSHVHTELLFDQDRNDLTRPQPEVQAVLKGIAAVDPAKHLALLRRGESSWAPGTTRGAQRLQAAPASGRCLHPFVDRCATESERGDNLRRLFALANALKRHAAYLYKRLVIKRATVNLHITFDWHRVHSFTKCSLN